MANLNVKQLFTNILNKLKANDDKIGDTAMGTTATTITGAIAEHETDISNLNSNLTARVHTMGEARYVYGAYAVTATSASTELARLQTFITQLDTSNECTTFDVLIQGAGYFRFSGYIYGDKSYGAGVWMSCFTGVKHWKRDNGTDTLA